MEIEKTYDSVFNQYYDETATMYSRGNCVLLVTFALLMNTLVAVLLIRVLKHQKTASNMLLLGIIFFDFLTGFSILPGALIFGTEKFVCSISGLLATVAVTSEMLLMTTLAIKRLLIFKKYTDKPIALYVILVVMIFGNIAISIVLVVKEEYQLMPAGTYCQINTNSSIISTIISLIILVEMVVCASILGLCYYKIGKIINRDLGFPVKEELSTGSNLQAKKNYTTASQQTFLLAIIFAFSYFPEVCITVYEISTDSVRNPWFDAFSGLVMASPCVINPFILLLLQDSIRAEFVKMIK